MGFKLFASFWLFFVLLILQEICGLERCWTWTHGESSDYNIQSDKNDTNPVIHMINTATVETGYDHFENVDGVFILESFDLNFESIVSHEMNVLLRFTQSISFLTVIP